MIVKAKIMLTKYTVEGTSPDWHWHEFEFTPQYDPDLPEDQRFNKATPSGKLVLRVDNPPVVAEWLGMLGRQFYLELTPADPPA